jgi:hypothetical protein
MSAPVLDERQFQLVLKNRDFRLARIEGLRGAQKKNSKFLFWETLLFWCLFISISICLSLWNLEFANRMTWLMPFLILTGIIGRTLRQTEARLIHTELRMLLAVDSILETNAGPHSETPTTDARA